MLELSQDGSNWRLGYGGDTLNTAIHLARFGHDVAYLTALGDDPFSHDLRDRWQAEGLDCSMVLADPRRHVGLYAISNDISGERSFTYWRDNSAARAMLSLPGMPAALEAAAKADLLCFSLITLAILPADAREQLLSLARQVRANGGQVAFDGNYRPKLWIDAVEARAARDAVIALADIGLPTLDDETALSGERDAATVAAHWTSLGCREPVVKLGAKGCRLADGNLIAPLAGLSPVDTSGAGDAFNAGYLSARFRGSDPTQAALAAHRLAGWVIMHRGAIPSGDPDTYARTC